MLEGRTDDWGDEEPDGSEPQLNVMPVVLRPGPTVADLQRVRDAERTAAWLQAAKGAALHRAEVDPGLLPPPGMYPHGIPEYISADGTEASPHWLERAHVSAEARQSYRDLQRAAQRAAQPTAFDLVERYADVLHGVPVASVLDDLYGGPAQPDTAETSATRGWEIEHVLAARSNLVILGDDKATKSTEHHELAVTLTTGSEHWGLLPYSGPVGHTILIQEENEHDVVLHDLAAIRQSRGLAAYDGTGLLTVYSKRGFNLTDERTRALLCYLVEGDAKNGLPPARNLLLDSLDKMGVPETNVTGQLADTLGFLTQLQRRFGCRIIFSWPVASRSGFAFESALGGDIIPRWWTGALLLDWNDKTKLRRIKTCALRSRMGRHDLRLRGLGQPDAEGVVPPGQWEFAARTAQAQAEPDAAAASTAADDDVLRKARALLAEKPKAAAADLQQALGVSRSYAYKLLKAAKE